MARPFLQCHHRCKNGKDHCYWSIAEKVRTHRGWVQRHLLYLGEINDSQKAAWTKLTEVFDPQSEQTRPLALYPADRQVPDHAAEYGVQVRLSDPPVQYLVGTPKGRLSKYGQALLDRPWQVVREGVQVKLLPQEKELYVLAQSNDRVSKERAMRRRQLKGLVKRLKELRAMALSRDQLLLKLGAAKALYPAAWRLVHTRVPDEEEPVNEQTFSFSCVRTNCARCAAERAGICCAAI